jgi:hypothetical protein
MRYAVAMDFKKLRESQQPGGEEKDVSPPRRVTGIVKVRTDHYCPANVEVRSKIDERLFTAEFSSDQLAALRSDPQIETVSVSQPIPLQKPPK